MRLDTQELYWGKYLWKTCRRMLKEGEESFQTTGQVWLLWRTGTGKEDWVERILDFTVIPRKIQPHDWRTHESKSSASGIQFLAGMGSDLYALHAPSLGPAPGKCSQLIYPVGQRLGHKYIVFPPVGDLKDFYDPLTLTSQYNADQFWELQSYIESFRDPGSCHLWLWPPQVPEVLSLQLVDGESADNVCKVTTSMDFTWTCSCYLCSNCIDQEVVRCPQLIAKGLGNIDQLHTTTIYMRQSTVPSFWLELLDRWWCHSLIQKNTGGYWPQRK